MTDHNLRDIASRCDAKITYGYTVSWRVRGERVSVSVSVLDSIDAAARESFDAAKRLGYRRPSWWQLTRWLTEFNYEAIAARGGP